MDSAEHRPLLQVWHADAGLLVVEKPPGLLSVPGRGEAGRNNVAAAVQARFADALVVHRLDMATSGLMLFARGAAAQRALSLAFEKRRVFKQYVAWVEGCIAAERGLVELPLRVDWPNRPRQVVDLAAGRPASTHWEVIGREPGRTRVALRPVTGRSHQLRVHLAQLGHPIVGDELYGTAGPRLLLHASTLGFAHPATGEPVRFDSPVPF